MESDQSSYFNSSMLFKASILTLSFSAFYFYKSGKQFVFLQMPIANMDTVLQEPEKIIVKKKKRKTIYLTFDDGPNKGTKTVMDILKDEQVPATLFVIGEHVYGTKRQLQLYDSLKQSNLFEVANHSYTHAFENKYNKFYDEPDSAVQDFVRCSDSLHFSNTIIRTPGRNIWRTKSINSTDLKGATTTADSLYSKGFVAIGWDVEWYFNSSQRLVQTDSDMVEIIDRAFAHKKTKTAGHLVLLAHDRTFKTADDSLRLRRFVTALKRKNEYDFELISRYPGAINDPITLK